MKDNVLYCYPVGGVGNEKGYPRTSRIILPSVLVDSAINLSNDHLLIGGYTSAKKTLERVSRFFVFDKINLKVREFCENCNVCLRKNKLHRTVKPT